MLPRTPRHRLGISASTPARSPAQPSRQVSALSFPRPRFIPVVITYPILRGVGIFVASFGGQVEEVVGRVHQVDATRIRRVGVINVPVLIAVKRADTLEFIIHLRLEPAVL